MISGNEDKVPRVNVARKIFWRSGYTDINNEYYEQAKKKDHEKISISKINFIFFIWNIKLII